MTTNKKPIHQQLLDLKHWAQPETKKEVSTGGKLKEKENNISYNSTTGKIFKDDPNVRIPQKDLVNQIQKEQDQKEIYPSGMGDEKNYKSDPRTPNQRKKDAWAEKIAKKPKPKPVPLEWDWRLAPWYNFPEDDDSPQWWEEPKESYPWDEDTSIQTPKGIIRAFVQKPRTDKGVASLFRLKNFS